MSSHDQTQDLTIVVPTRNEGENVEALVAELMRHAPHGTRVIFVDDSDNDVPPQMYAAQEAAAGCLDVHVEYRPKASRKNGLAGAITLGFELAKPGTLVLCMDGDLQHPPDTIPAMLTAAASADLAVASRYCPGGSSAGLDGLVRHIVSRLSTVVAKTLFPKLLHGVTDPMTGFFAVPKDLVDTSLLQTGGFKILLEILVTHPQLSRTQVPVRFRKRDKGESKGTFDQGLHYLRQLIRLRLDHFKPKEA